MAKMTMLEMVQGILSDGDSDEINAIGETVESEQVAWVIEQTYRNLTEADIIPEHKALIQLESLGDVTKPNYLKIPTRVIKIDWVKYDVRDPLETRTRHKNIPFMDQEEFIRNVLGRDNDNTDTDLIQDFSGVLLPIRNDREPSFWTAFDDEYMVFDAYDQTVEATLQESKTVVWGQVRPAFNRFDNGFVPDLDGNYFPLFYNQAKALYFDQFKQTQTPIVAALAREQKTKVQNKKAKTNTYIDTPDYGRQTNKGTTRRNKGKHRS